MRRLIVLLFFSVVLATSVGAQKWSRDHGTHEPTTPSASEENRLSYWGFRHKSLHDRGIPDQLRASTGENCCSGVSSGECRVTRVDMVKHLAMIDGEWCPISKDTAIVPIEDLNKDEEAVLCAGKTYTVCPQTYCLGLRGGT